MLCLSFNGSLRPVWTDIAVKMSHRSTATALFLFSSLPLGLSAPQGVLPALQPPLAPIAPLGPPPFPPADVSVVSAVPAVPVVPDVVPAVLAVPTAPAFSVVPDVVPTAPAVSVVPDIVPAVPDTTIDGPVPAVPGIAAVDTAINTLPLAPAPLTFPPEPSALVDPIPPTDSTVLPAVDSIAPPLPSIPAPLGADDANLPLVTSTPDDFGLPPDIDSFQSPPFAPVDGPVAPVLPPLDPIPLIQPPLVDPTFPEDNNTLQVIDLPPPVNETTLPLPNNVSLPDNTTSIDNGNVSEPVVVGTPINLPPPIPHLFLPPNLTLAPPVPLPSPISVEFPEETSTVPVSSLAAITEPLLAVIDALLAALTGGPAPTSPDFPLIQSPINTSSVPEPLPVETPLPVDTIPVPAPLPVDTIPVPAPLPVDTALPVDTIPVPAPFPVNTTLPLDTIPVPAPLPVDTALPVDTIPVPAPLPVDTIPVPAPLPVDTALPLNTIVPVEVPTVPVPAPVDTLPVTPLPLASDTIPGVPEPAVDVLPPVAVGPIAPTVLDATPVQKRQISSLDLDSILAIIQPVLDSINKLMASLSSASAATPAVPTDVPTPDVGLPISPADVISDVAPQLPTIDTLTGDLGDVLNDVPSVAVPVIPAVPTDVVPDLTSDFDDLPDVPLDPFGLPIPSVPAVSSDVIPNVADAIEQAIPTSLFDPTVPAIAPPIADVPLLGDVTAALPTELSVPLASDVPLAADAVSVVVDAFATDIPEVSLPIAFPDLGLPTDAAPTLPTDAIFSLPTDIIAALPTDVVAALPTDVAALPTDVAAALPTDVAAALPTDFATIASDVLASLPTPVVGLLPTEFPGDVVDAIPTDVVDSTFGVATDVPEILNSTVPIIEGAAAGQGPDVALPIPTTPDVSGILPEVLPADVPLPSVPVPDVTLPDVAVPDVALPAVPAPELPLAGSELPIPPVAPGLPPLPVDPLAVGIPPIAPLPVEIPAAGIPPVPVVPSPADVVPTVPVVAPSVPAVVPPAVPAVPALAPAVPALPLAAPIPAVLPPTAAIPAVPAVAPGLGAAPILPGTPGPAFPLGPAKKRQDALAPVDASDPAKVLAELKSLVKTLNDLVSSLPIPSTAPLQARAPTTLDPQTVFEMLQPLLQVLTTIGNSVPVAQGSVDSLQEPVTSILTGLQRRGVSVATALTPVSLPLTSSEAVSVLKPLVELIADLITSFTTTDDPVGLLNLVLPLLENVNSLVKTLSSPAPMGLPLGLARRHIAAQIPVDPALVGDVVRPLYDVIDRLVGELPPLDADAALKIIAPVLKSANAMLAELPAGAVDDISESFPLARRTLQEFAAQGSSVDESFLGFKGESKREKLIGLIRKSVTALTPADSASASADADSASMETTLLNDFEKLDASDKATLLKFWTLETARMNLEQRSMRYARRSAQSAPWALPSKGTNPGPPGEISAILGKAGTLDPFGQLQYDHYNLPYADALPPGYQLPQSTRRPEDQLIDSEVKAALGPAGTLDPLGMLNTNTDLPYADEIDPSLPSTPTVRPRPKFGADFDGLDQTLSAVEKAKSSKISAAYFDPATGELVKTYGSAPNPLADALRGE
jgi:hypothetical protein